ncbi:unnamed protein product, partial [Arabidopsis halleri]
MIGPHGKKQYFAYLPEMIGYVETFYVEKDLVILRANDIHLGEDALSVFKVQHLMLIEGVLGGHVPRDIAQLMTNNLSLIVDMCKGFQTTGGKKHLMENIRGNIKQYLEFAREARLESESLNSKVQPPIQ